MENTFRNLIEAIRSELGSEKIKFENSVDQQEVKFAILELAFFMGPLAVFLFLFGE